MQSILLPADLTLSITIPTSNNTTITGNVSNLSPKKYIKRVGPRGSFIKKRGNFFISQVATSEGTRVFVSGVSSQQESLILAQLWKQAIGLSRGYRKCLRLVGIGFRGIKQLRSFPSGSSREALPLLQQDISNKSTQTAQKKALLPKYRVRQLKKIATPEYNTANSTQSKRDSLLLKLGYSHDSVFPLTDAQKNNSKVEISRPEGRTKGTVIHIEGANRSKVSSIAAEIQSYRVPDIYKGKGIHANGVSLKLKKGKRQG